MVQFAMTTLPHERNVVAGRGGEGGGALVDGANQARGGLGGGILVYVGEREPV